MKYSGEIIEAFESYAAEAARILSDNGEGHRVRDYLKNHVSISDFAAGWNASRASLCVELPDRIDRGCDCESCDCGNSSDRESVARADAHNALLLELSEAITKTGVRVK